MRYKKLKSAAIALILLAGMLSAPIGVYAGLDPFVGEISLFPYTFVPTGWASCDGQILPISQNTALFSLLGTTYGGDGKSNFALPNLNNGAEGGTTNPLGENVGRYCIALQGVFPPRQ
jgi:microcystin-dependent protein